jgi:protein-S-isoprenylcysteine O-methyltransferase Ste14
MFQRSAILVYGIVGYTIGVSSLVGWILCMLGVLPFGILAPDFASRTAAVAFASVLVLVFAAQHTVMARPAFKAWWTGLIPESAERSTFVLMTGLVLWLVLLLWPAMPQVLWSVGNASAEAVIYAIALAGWAYLFAASFAIDHFELFGLQQVYCRFVGREYHKVPFKERWMYRFDRHPIMTGALVGMWAAPEMTLDHFCFSTLVTLYIVFGVSVEERDLVAQWGDEYVDYAKRVRSIVPVIRR